MKPVTLKLTDLPEIVEAVSSVYGYKTDNSCSDPDCCGGPLYTEDEYDRGINLLRGFGIEVVS